MKSLCRPGFPPNMKEKSREPEALRDFFCLQFVGLPTDALALSGMCWADGVGWVLTLTGEGASPCCKRFAGVEAGIPAMSGLVAPSS